MEPISGGIYDLLVRQGIMAGDRVGARKLARKTRRGLATNALNKGAGVSHEGDCQLSKADTAGGELQRLTGGEKRPIYLCWINPHMTKATGRKSRAALVICE